MTRSEYLMALYDALSDIPAEERTEIVSEYRDYFNNEIAKGHTEEEVCVSLGDPVTLAYAIKQRRGYGQPPKQPPVKQGHPGSLRLFRIIIGVVIAMFIFSVIGLSVSHEIGRGLFGILNKYEVDEEKELDLGSADTIVIRTKISDVKVSVSNGSKVYASLKGSVMTTSKQAVPKLEVTRDGNRIVIKEYREAKSITHLSGGVKLDITIPASFNGKIDFEGSSGSFGSNGLELESFYAKLSSGDIDLEDISLKDALSIESSSGNISLDSLKAKEAYIKSTSGNKNLDHISVEGNITFISSSGNNEINDVECRFLSVNCTSGETTINGLKGKLDVDSTSGNISITLDKLIGGIDINASSGDIKLRIPSHSDFSIDCSVSSGDIDCAFDLDKANTGKKSLRGSYGAGTYPISIKTTSGNIRIMD